MSCFTAAELRVNESELRSTPSGSAPAAKAMRRWWVWVCEEVGKLHDRLERALSISLAECLDWIRTRRFACLRRRNSI